MEKQVAERLDIDAEHDVVAVAVRGQVVIRCKCGEEFAKGKEVSMPDGSFGWMHLTDIARLRWRAEHPDWPRCHDH